MRSRSENRSPCLQQFIPLKTLPLKMVQHDLRALMPALANKTYFNNPALPKRLAEIDWAAMVLSERQDWL